MFLHIGADTVVRMKDIIAVFDIKAGRTPIGESFIKNIAQDSIVDIAEGCPKSFIITDKKVYLSAISSVTIKKRAEYGFSVIGEDDFADRNRG